MKGRIRKDLIRSQKDEIMGYLVYTELSRLENNSVNKQILLDIAEQELHHYNLLKKYTSAEPKASRLKVWFYCFAFRLFGTTFGVKLMEKEEVQSNNIYSQYKDLYPEIAEIAIQEEEHEDKLISMLKDKNVSFMSAVVLGMNDALVELTGSLAGFTLALQNTELIALLGGITGVSAAMSMAASEYLAEKAEKGTRIALKSSAYTGVSYLITVIVLILPYAFIQNVFLALLITLVVATAVIALFNFYYSVMKDESFKKRFVEMLVISFSVVVISFAIGYFLKRFTGISV